MWCGCKDFCSEAGGPFSFFMAPSTGRGSSTKAGGGCAHRVAPPEAQLLAAAIDWLGINYSSMKWGLVKRFPGKVLGLITGNYPSSPSC